MKRLIINLVIYAAMASCIWADEFMRVEYAGNLAIFAAWFFILTGFIALFAPPERLFDGSLLLPAVSKAAQYLVIGFMVTIGWTVTGSFYFLVAIAMHIKHSAYKDTLKSTAEA